MSGLDAWQLDLPTRLWAVWMVGFVLLESWAVATSQPEHTLTWHLRPVFHSHPLAWFLLAGFLCWMCLHFLAPGFEQRLLDVVL